MIKLCPKPFEKVPEDSGEVFNFDLFEEVEEEPVIVVPPEIPEPNFHIHTALDYSFTFKLDFKPFSFDSNKTAYNIEFSVDIDPDCILTYDNFEKKFLIGEICEDFLIFSYEAAIAEYTHLFDTDNKKLKIFNFIKRLAINSKKSLNKAWNRQSNSVEFFEFQFFKSSTYIF